MKLFKNTLFFTVLFTFGITSARSGSTNQSALTRPSTTLEKKTIPAPEPRPRVNKTTVIPEENIYSLSFAQLLLKIRDMNPYEVFDKNNNFTGNFIELIENNKFAIDEKRKILEAGKNLKLVLSGNDIKDLPLLNQIQNKIDGIIDKIETRETREKTNPVAEKPIAEINTLEIKNITTQAGPQRQQDINEFALDLVNANINTIKAKLFIKDNYGILTYKQGPESIIFLKTLMQDIQSKFNTVADLAIVTALYGAFKTSNHFDTNSTDYSGLNDDIFSALKI